LLRQLGAHASELSVLNWVAETFFRLAEAFGGLRFRDAGVPRRTIKRRLRLSRKPWNGLVGREAEDPDSAEKGIALRRSHKYPSAMTTFEEILRENPVIPDGPSRSGQDMRGMGVRPWQGVALRASDFWRSADPRTKQSVVWGWAKIGNATAPDPKFKDTFHEARYHVALCRCKWAESKRGTERDKLLDTPGGTSS